MLYQKYICALAHNIPVINQGYLLH